jgi:AraC family transcriptional regulator
MLSLKYCSNTSPQLIQSQWNCQPLLSSKDLNWQDIQFDYYQHHPDVLAQHRNSQHLLKIFLSQGEVKHSLNGQERVENVSPGDVAIIPANTSHHARCQNAIEFILLSLQPNLLRDLARNKANCTTVKILPQFTVRDPLISGIATTLKTQLENNRNSCSNYAHILANAIAIHLCKKYSEPSSTVDNTCKSAAEKKLQVALKYIEQNLDEKLTLGLIAEQVNLSKYYLCRLFVRHLNTSPHQYIIQKRIIKSKQLLKQKLSMQIVDIAFDCGFASHSHFNRQFNKNVGMSPKAYRNAG